MVFRTEVAFRNWGFQILYLSPNAASRTLESGYRIFNKGMKGAVEGAEWSIAEECIWKDSLYRRMTV